MHCAKRDSGLSKRENEERGWSRMGQRKQGGDAATTRGCKFLKHDGNEVPMQCK